MPTIELRRHAFTKKGDGRGRGSHLSADGVRAAAAAGASLGPFDRVLASTSPRTAETAIAMGFAVDDLLDMPSPTETGEIAFHEWRAWEDPFSTFRRLADESPTVDRYLRRQAERLLAAVDGGAALAIGHGGWLEAVVAALVEPNESAGIGASFWHLDGVRLAVDGTTGRIEAVRRTTREPPRRRQTHSTVRDGRRLVWHTENLWSLAGGLPRFEIALDDVKAWTGAPALDEDCWFGGRPATLRDVARHAARITAADPAHPIILNDDGTLMDGGHRLCRALLHGRPTVIAVQFPTMPPPDEVHDVGDGRP